MVAVQEVGPPPALDDLAAAVGGEWHTAVADPDGRGIRVGLLARRDVEQIVDLPAGLGPVQVDDTGRSLTRLGRPALKATLRLDGRDVHVVSVHLKSKQLTAPDGAFSTTDEGLRARFAVYALHRRAAEAAGVRTYVTGLLEQGSGPEVPAVVVAGDLNDEGTAATTQILYGPPGSELSKPGFSRPDAGDAQRLWNLDALIPTNERFSRVYRGRGELIDHILVSAPLVHTVTSVTAGPGATPRSPMTPTLGGQTRIRPPSGPCRLHL